MREETFSVVSHLKKLRWIFSNQFPITVFCNHKLVDGMFHAAEMSRLIRSMLLYIVYILGEDNAIAGCFSRLGKGVDQVESIHDVGHMGTALVAE